MPGAPQPVAYQAPGRPAPVPGRPASVQQLATQVAAVPQAPPPAIQRPWVRAAMIGLGVLAGYLLYRGIKSVRAGRTRRPNPRRRNSGGDVTGPMIGDVTCSHCRKRPASTKFGKANVCGFCLVDLESAPKFDAKLGKKSKIKWSEPHRRITLRAPGGAWDKSHR